MKPTLRCWVCWLVGIMIGSAGCIPAQELPSQLTFTPGAPITVTDYSLKLDGFIAAYPSGWRIVTSPAENPYSVLLIAPDHDALIMLSRYEAQSPPPLETVPSNQQTTFQKTIQLLSEGQTDSGIIYAWLVSSTEQASHYQVIFDQVSISIVGKLN